MRSRSRGSCTAGRDRWAGTRTGLPACAQTGNHGPYHGCAAMAEAISVNEDCPCPMMEVLIND
ncbi:MAG: hypothetical protein ACLTW9_22070 [Enterocloster sp.]